MAEAKAKEAENKATGAVESAPGPVDVTTYVGCHVRKFSRDEDGKKIMTPKGKSVSESIFIPIGEHTVTKEIADQLENAGALDAPEEPEEEEPAKKGSDKVEKPAKKDEGGDK